VGGEKNPRPGRKGARSRGEGEGEGARGDKKGGWGIRTRGRFTGE